MLIRWMSEDKKGNITGLLSRSFHVLRSISLGLLLLVMMVLLFFWVQSRIMGRIPNIFGYRMYVVLSGSMSPAFEAGSIVMVHQVDSNQLKIGDIITFKDTEDENKTITHRIEDINVSDGRLSFITRGDANNIHDAVPVSTEKIIGKVAFTIPRVGLLISFCQTKKGIIFMVILPGVLIIIMEALNLFKYANHLEQAKKVK